MSGMDQGAARDDVDVAAEIATALQRAGVRATAEQIAALVDPRVRMRDGLERLRERLGPSIEPALTFPVGGGAHSLEHRDGG